MIYYESIFESANTVARKMLGFPIDDAIEGIPYNMWQLYSVYDGLILARIFYHNNFYFRQMKIRNNNSFYLFNWTAIAHPEFDESYNRIKMTIITRTIHDTPLGIRAKNISQNTTYM